MEQDIYDYLTEFKKKLGISNNSKIKYVDIKYRYEIEIPEDLVKTHSIPEDFEMTSNR